MTYYERPLDFITDQGWKHRTKGSEIIATCPLCEKEEHLYMNGETGQWKCHHCGEKGNLYQLKKKLGLIGTDRSITSIGQVIGSAKKIISVDQVEKFHKNLLADQEALDYCRQDRKWSSEIIDRLKLGLRTDSRGKWIAYPYLRGGSCAGVKFRILPAYLKNYPQRFERERGCESILYNTDALQQYDEVILLSGESDLVSALTLGFENVIATSVGETGLPPAAVDALSKKPKIWALFDNDTTGPKGAREVARRIGYERTFNAVLPEGTKDVNEFLIKGAQRSDLQRILDCSKQFDVPSIVSLDQALDQLTEEKTLGTRDCIEEVTGWPTLNKKLGAWRGGNLIVVSGPQGTGKTTFVLNALTHWAQSSYPALLYCLEMTIAELVQHLLCSYYQRIEKEITPALIEQARHDLANWPLYLGANPRITEMRAITEMLKQAVKRYGLKLLAFDNLHMLARSVDHRSEEIGVITKSFKLLAMEMEIPLILIAQPRKLTPGKVMTPWDLKDSVDIFSDADQIILLHRELIGSTCEKNAVQSAVEGAEIYDSKTLVRIAKSRHMAGKDALLYFEGAQHRFREILPDDLQSMR
jgi:archaellum biogenesis ATPase FlaH